MNERMGQTWYYYIIFLVSRVVRVLQKKQSEGLGEGRILYSVILPYSV